MSGPGGSYERWQPFEKMSEIGDEWIMVTREFLEYAHSAFVQGHFRSWAIQGVRYRLVRRGPHGVFVAQKQP